MINKKGYYTYPSSARLKKRASYLQVKDDGISQASKHFIAAFLRREGSTIIRLGVSITKKVEPLAVRRSRVKRLIREVFRTSKPDFILGGDLVIIARRGASDLSYKHVETELKKLFTKLRLL